MNKKIVVFSLVIVAAGLIAVIVALVKESVELKKKLKAQEQVRQKYEERNKQKENMETGDAVNDFNNSIDLLHDLASKN